MLRAEALGLDVAYHAVGDLAVRSVLDAVEEVERRNGVRDRRPRIEHLEVVSAADEPRFASLGVIASAMPAHAEPGDEPSGGVWCTKVGPERLHRAFAFGDLIRARARIAFGSDWPVVGVNPLHGLAVAVTRLGPDGKPPGGWIPEQRVSLDDALRGYTSGAAYALRLEAETGVLRQGMAADLVVLAKTVDLEHPSSLEGGAVDVTIAAGKVVYEGAPRQ